MTDRLRVRSLEYPIVEHCNLACEHCDHASPFLPPRFADLDQFRRDLGAMAPALHAEELRVLGGEPLLHPDLVAFVDAARSAGVAREVTLVTNGTLLHRAPEKMWTLIDRLWLSIYPGVSIRVPLDELRRRCEAHGVVFDAREIGRFRQTLVNTPIQPPLVQVLYDSCKLAHEWHCYTVYDGFFYKCSPAPFVPGRLRRRGVELQAASDGVPLHANPDLAAALRAYLGSRRPLAACSYCLGSSGFEFPLRMLNARERQAALARDDGDHRSLVDAGRLPHA